MESAGILMILFSIQFHVPMCNHSSVTVILIHFSSHHRVDVYISHTNSPTISAGHASCILLIALPGYTSPILLTSSNSRVLMYSSASLYFPRSSSCILRYQSCFPCFLASSSASSGEAWRHTLMAISTSKSTSRSFVWNVNASLHIRKHMWLPWRKTQVM